MTPYKMRVIYNPTTKKIESGSISCHLTPTCKQVCKYHDATHIIDESGNCTNCQYCFTVDKDENAIMKSFLYKVDDSDINNKRPVKQKMKKLVWSCDQTLLYPGPPPRYSILENTIANITVNFQDEDGISVYPVGRLEFKIDSGKVNPKYFDLAGDIDHVNFTWKSPKDNNKDVKFKVRLTFWHRLAYNHGVQMVMEIE